MKKARRGKKGMRHMTYVLAGILLLMRPVSVCATAPLEEESQSQAISENTVPSDSDSQEDTVQLITEIEALSEEQSYYSYGEKPDLTQLTSDFPEELSVKTENAEEYFALPVTWECEDDYEDTETDSYLFYPKWDETLYALEGETEIPFILVEIIEEDSWKMIPDIEQAKSDLHSILQAKSVMALVYLCDTYTVKAEASEDAEDVASVASGQSVLIQDVALGTNGNVWYQVLFYEGEKEYKGYVERDYLITSDTEFCEWEETHIDLSRMISLMSMQSADVEQFPASYQTSLYRLKEAHPNWVFVRMDTGLDWSTVILNENKDAKNLVSASRPDSWKNGQATQGWYHATEAVLKYYMDPRNFLSDPYIFQFEQLTYNPSYHTSDAVQGILNGSFMASAIPGDSRTYAQAFEQIGKELGVSPFHLSSRVLQEQGKKGTSALISGIYSGFEGYYNYFNVGASGKTNQLVIQNGLQKAKDYGWDARYKSLYGGAEIIGNKYILQGQDTLYLQKFNVSNGCYPNYTHQYMQNVEAPYSESQSIRKAYNNAGVLDQMFVFRIPVYRNMPVAACSKPNTTDTLTLNKTSIDSLAVNQTQVLIPYVNGSLIDDVSAVNFASNDESVATVSDDGMVTAVSPGTATITCRRGHTTVSCTVTVVKANPSVTIPAPLPVTYCKELKLSDIDLPAGWAWVQGSTALAVGTAAYEALYTPSDTTKYNTVKKQISLTVTKAIPDYQVPEGLQANYGDELKTISLPSGFVWEDDADTKIEKTGEAVYYVSYNPDEKNYYTIDHIPVRIKVIGGGTSTPGSSSSTSTGTSGGSTSTPSSGTSTSNGSTNTDTSSTGTTSGTSTSTPGGSTSMPSTGTTSGTSTGTSGSSTSMPSTGTTSGTSTGTSGSSTSMPSTGTTSGTSTGTSGSSTSTPSTGTTSGTSTGTPGSGTSTPSMGTTSGTSTGTPGSGTSTPSMGTTSGTSTGTSGSSTSTPSTGTTSGTSTSTPGSSTSTPSSGTSTSGSSTSTPNSTSTNMGAQGGTEINATNSNTNNNISNNISNNTNTGTTNNTNTGTTNNTNTPTTNNTDASNNNTDTPNTDTPNSAVTQNGGGTPSASNASNVGTTAQSTGTENTGNAASPNVVASGGQPPVIREPEQIPETQFSVEEAAEEAQELTAYAKPSVTIDMHDTTVLTGEKIEMLKEQKLDLVLDMGNQMKWTIDADTVRSEARSAVDMGVSMVKGVISQELITAVAGERNYYEISLAHDGEFGFTAVLQIALNAEDIGRYANLFYYSPELQELQYVCSSIIDENAEAVFSFEHASDYLIIISDQPMTPGEEKLPEHSDGAVKWVIGLVIILAAGAVVGSILLFCTRRKQEDTDDDDSEDDEEYDENDEKDLTIVRVRERKQPKAEKQTEERKLTKKESEEPEEFDEYDGYDDSEEYDDSEDGYEHSEEYDDSEDGYEHSEEYDDSEDGYEHSEEYDDSEEEYDDSEENDWIDDDEWEKTKPKEAVLQEYTSDEEDDWIDDEEWEEAYHG